MLKPIFHPNSEKKWFQHSHKGGRHAIIAITTIDPEGDHMATIEPTLFSWQDVEATSDLDRFILVRDHLPDERIIQYQGGRGQTCVTS